MEVDNTNTCLQLMKLGDSANWHARVGHVGIETMRKMINKEIFTGIPDIIIEKETCESCLWGKKKD